MKAIMIWKDCQCFEPSQDAFWVQCLSSDLGRDITPFMSGNDRQVFLERKESYESTSWASTNPGLLVEKDSYYFLISRDGKFVIPTEPYYPYAGQWNSWCPFRTIAPVVVNSCGDMAAIEEEIMDLE